MTHAYGPFVQARAITVTVVATQGESPATPLLQRARAAHLISKNQLVAIGPNRRNAGQNHLVRQAHLRRPSLQNRTIFHCQGTGAQRTVETHAECAFGEDCAAAVCIVPPQSQNTRTCFVQCFPITGQLAGNGCGYIASHHHLSGVEGQLHGASCQQVAICAKLKAPCNLLSLYRYRAFVARKDRCVVLIPFAVCIPLKCRPVRVGIVPGAVAASTLLNPTGRFVSSIPIPADGTESRDVQVDVFLGGIIRNCVVIVIQSIHQRKAVRRARPVGEQSIGAKPEARKRLNLQRSSQNQPLVDDDQIVVNASRRACLAQLPFRGRRTAKHQALDGHGAHAATDAVTRSEGAVDGRCCRQRTNPGDDAVHPR